MKNYKEMSFTEQNEVAELFSNWLSKYTIKVVEKVMSKADEIITNEHAMHLLKELKTREDKEREERKNSMYFILRDKSEGEGFKDWCFQSHALTHSDAYREVLYDLYIRD